MISLRHLSSFVVITLLLQSRKAVVAAATGIGGSTRYGTIGEKLSKQQRTSFTKQRQPMLFSIPRGGAGVISSVADSRSAIAAKVAAVTYLGTGVMSFLLPQFTGKLIGIQVDMEKLPMVQIMITGIGSCLISIGSGGVGMFYMSDSTKHALILLYIPFAICLLRDGFSGMSTKVKQPISRIIFGITVNLILSLFAATNFNIKFTKIISTVWACIVFLTGIQFMYNPLKTLNAWGVTGTTSTIDLYLMQIYGILLCHVQFIVLNLIYHNNTSRKFVVPAHIIYGCGSLLSYVLFVLLELKKMHNNNSSSSSNVDKFMGFKKGPKMIGTILNVVLTIMMLLP